MKIFVTVGNALDPFDRLLLAVDSARRALALEGTCQHGVSSIRVGGLENVASMGKDRFEELLRQCDQVICHAGVGTLWSALRVGHRPIVMARRLRYREHVNDHQLEISEELAKDGRIALVEDADQLNAELRMLSGREPRRHSTMPAPDLEPLSRAICELRGRPHGRPLLKWLAALAPPLNRLKVPHTK